KEAQQQKDRGTPKLAVEISAPLVPQIQVNRSRQHPRDTDTAIFGEIEVSLVHGAAPLALGQNRQGRKRQSPARPARPPLGNGSPFPTAYIILDGLCLCNSRRGRAPGVIRRSRGQS